MKRSTKYVALDVHQATTVASVREESGRVIARSIFDTEETAIPDFFVGMRGGPCATTPRGAPISWVSTSPQGQLDGVALPRHRTVE